MGADCMRSDNRDMKRATAVFALGATMFVAVWLGAAVSARRTRTSGVRYGWPMGLGTLDEVPQHYPPRDTSHGATRLIALATAAGIDLSPPLVGGTPPRGMATAFRPALNDYLDKQLARTDNVVDPLPAELVQYFAVDGAALAEVRAYLVGRAAIVWPTDVVAAAVAPLPNLSGHFALTRLLVAHA